MNREATLRGTQLLILTPYPFTPIFAPPPPPLIPPRPRPRQLGILVITTHTHTHKGLPTPNRHLTVPFKFFQQMWRPEALLPHPPPSLPYHHRRRRLQEGKLLKQLISAV